MRKIKIQKPSEDFFSFLKVVNLMRGKDLPDFAALTTRYSDAALMTDTIPNPSKGFEWALNEFISRINQHPDFCEYMFGKKSLPRENFNQELPKYEEFLDDMSLLLQITDRCALMPASVKKKDFHVALIQKYVSVRIDPNGFLKYAPLVNKRFQDIDARRFKICPVCNDIFWLPRLDKEACSRCSNVYRQRKLLADKKKRSEINEKRRENYKNAKNGTVRIVKRNKKNGTL